MAEERIKGQKSNFHALSCYHGSNATHLLYQPLVEVLHHFTVHQLHQCVQHWVMKVIQGKKIAVCGDALVWKWWPEEPNSPASIENTSTEKSSPGSDL